METRIRIIGLVIPDLTDTHFAGIARGVASVVEPQGYMLLISSSDGEAASEKQALNLLCTCPNVEGLLVASSLAPGDAEFFVRLQSYKPFVLVHRDFPGLDANFAGSDDAALGFAAAEHLISRGCRHIAHIGGPAASAGAGRTQGYENALARHGLKVSPGYVAAGGADDGAGYAAMRRLLSVNPRLDGVVCYNDAVAVGAIKAILGAGLEVPCDIEVIGAGNMHYSDILRVPLSTIDLNSRTIGERAAALLLEAIADPAVRRRMTVDFKLVARESSVAAFA